MIESYLARGYDGPLTLTPCDFWPFVRGRTIWFLGDSQTLDFYKVGGRSSCSPACETLPLRLAPQEGRRQPHVGS